MNAGVTRALFVASEAHPLIKTGGLGDVAGSLPRALRNLGVDLRLLLPAYSGLLERAGRCVPVATTEIGGCTVSILQTRLPGSRVRVWLADCPPLYGRAGNPYTDADGLPWADNAERFSIFSRVAVSIALDQLGLGWRPDVVHCNDWQTGLVPALLGLEDQRPASIFTIHNLAYQGLFPDVTFRELGLPAHLWRHEALEFHNQLSFLKGGLVYADRINTVSPSYAQEIQTPAMGCGMDGILRHRKNRLSGILNGVDMQEWNPGSDSNLPHTYNYRRLAGKSENKRALQQHFRLPVKSDDIPLVGLVGRLVHQKGIDIILGALPRLARLPLQMVLLGSGDKRFESSLRKAAAKYPDRIGVHIGYDERLAHLIEAGADAFLMPSRFEPCGLNQMYSLRYGTLPIVSSVGGLADTVCDITEENIADGTASGFVIKHLESDGLIATVDRMLGLYRDKTTWLKIQRAGMLKKFSWKQSAQQYLSLYSRAMADNLARAD